MDDRRYVIFKLDSLEAKLRAAVERGTVPAYVALKERFSKVKQEQIARFEWDATWAQREGRLDGDVLERMSENAALVEACIGWVREKINESCSTSAATYRAYVYKDNTGDTLFTLSMPVRQDSDDDDEGYDRADEDGDLTIEKIDTIAAQGTLRNALQVLDSVSVALVNALKVTERVARVAESQTAAMGKHADAMQTRHERQIGSLEASVEDRDSQIRMLVDSILERRNSDLEARETAVRESEEALNRARNIDRAIDRVTDTAKAVYMAHKGLTPEIGNLLETLMQRPELMAALRDPQIAALLKDPKAATSVASALQQFAEMHAASQAAAQAQADTSPTPDEGTPQETA